MPTTCPQRVCPTRWRPSFLAAPTACFVLAGCCVHVADHVVTWPNARKHWGPFAVANLEEVSDVQPPCRTVLLTAESIKERLCVRDTRIRRLSVCIRASRGGIIRIDPRSVIPGSGANHCHW